MPLSPARVPGPVPTELSNYSGLERVWGLLYAPSSIEELAGVLAVVRRSGKRISFRCGGHALDSQSLNSEIVISLAKLASIEVDAFSMPPRVVVGPGARWGDILEATRPQGLVPHVVVTTGAAAAGGTLSGDCLSRFSPAFGKEGHHVLAFELLTLDGKLLTCSERENGDLFRAVIGGLGYLGAVVRITYELLRVSRPGEVVRVRTVATHARSWEELAEQLVPKAHDAHERAKSAGLSADYRADVDHAIWSVGLATRPEGEALVFEARYTGDERLRPMITHQPNHWARIPLELLMRCSWLNQLLWRIIARFYFQGRERVFVDELEGFTFFMDGNVRTKAWGERLGLRMNTVQQTFVVPRDETDHLRTRATLSGFLREATVRLRDGGVTPSMIDVLFVPGTDDGFLLSASSGLPGFAVTLTFETSSDARLTKIRQRLRELSNICQGLGGRVHLVKSVFAAGEDLEAMYGPRLASFFETKRRLDPRFRICNAFLERTFPGRVPAPLPGDGDALPAIAPA